MMGKMHSDGALIWVQSIQRAVSDKQMSIGRYSRI